MEKLKEQIKNILVEYVPTNNQKEALGKLESIFDANTLSPSTINPTPPPPPPAQQ